MDANLIKIHYKQSAYTTTDNLKTTCLKTRNKLTNSRTIYIVRQKNWEYNKTKADQKN